MACARWRPHHGYNDDEPKEAHSHVSFSVGESLLLRDELLRCYDVPVELRGIDGNVAVVLCRNRLQRVPVGSLRRM